MFIGCRLFVEYWKRKQYTVAMTWGVIGWFINICIVLLIISIIITTLTISCYFIPFRCCFLSWLHCTGFEDSEQDRPQFKGKRITSPIDGRDMTYFEVKDKNRKHNIVLVGHEKAVKTWLIAVANSISFCNGIEGRNFLCHHNSFRCRGKHLCHPMVHDFARKPGPI